MVDVFLLPTADKAGAESTITEEHPLIDDRRKGDKKSVHRHPFRWINPAQSSGLTVASTCGSDKYRLISVGFPFDHARTRAVQILVRTLGSHASLPLFHLCLRPCDGVGVGYWPYPPFVRENTEIRTCWRRSQHNRHQAEADNRSDFGFCRNYLPTRRANAGVGSKDRHSRGFRVISPLIFLYVLGLPFRNGTRSAILHAAFSFLKLRD